MIVNLLMLIITAGVLITAIYLYNYVVRNINKNNNNIELSFEELNSVIDTVIIEITMNKYNLFYRLKEVAIIPDMEKDAHDITFEIIKAFSETFNNEIYRFYSKEYFYSMITRKVQMFLIEYTDKHKPNIK